MYSELLVPVDNSRQSNSALDRALELGRQFGGRVTGSHVYGARLHDVRFRQLETGLPAKFHASDEIKRQRKVHDKLIEKGLQLIADSFLDQVDERCRAAGVPLRRQLLEGIHYEEIVREANRGAGQLPGLIGFKPGVAEQYDGGTQARTDIRSGDDGRIVAEAEDPDERLAGSSNRQYDLVVMGAHGIGKQPSSQLGGVVARSLRKIERDVLVVRDDRPLQGGRLMVCVDGSAYCYRGMRVALELARAFNAKLYVCSAFDVEYHHAVFGNIRDVLSEQASKVFKFEEQEELHNNIIDKGLLRLAQANIKRAQVMAQQYPDVALETQVLIGKPFHAVLRWAAEIEPSLLVIARHGSHRIEGTDLGSQAENLVRLAPTNVLVVGTAEVGAEDVPRIEEDGLTGLEWTPEAEVRILRVPPFALGIARRAVEEYVVEHYANGDGVLPVVTNERLDEGIKTLLPTHMQLIMGIGTAEELALAEVKADEAMQRTVVAGSDSDQVGEPPMVEARCPGTGRVLPRPRTAKDPVVWTHEAFERLRLVPLIARPMARNLVERFAREHGQWRVTTQVMDQNKQGMIEADDFDVDTMLVMFKELEAKQLRAAAEGVDGLSPEMRRFIEEAKASGASRCPIRDIEKQMAKCPVDFRAVTPEQARKAVEHLMKEPAEGGGPPGKALAH